MKKVLAIIAGAAFALGGAAGALALLKSHPAGAPHPAWTEVAWPFPVDQWGRGKAFRCKGADCGADVSLYLRAKIGFCNCVTGVSDDAELDRMSDFDLIGAGVPQIGRASGRERV